MKRGIIALEDFNETKDPNDLDFSSFESVISGDLDEINSDIDMTVMAIDDLEGHQEITDIIATEGFGNCPGLAQVALRRYEIRLFGKEISTVGIGTESITRVAVERKNVFVRVWDAIIKFLKNMWKKIQSFFGGDSEKKTKKKKKDVENAKVDKAAKAIDAVDESAIDGNSSGGKDTGSDGGKDKTVSSVVKMMKAMRNSKELYGYDGSKIYGPKELLGPTFKKLTSIPALIDSEAKKVTSELEEETFKLIDDAANNTDYKIDGVDVSNSSKKSDSDVSSLDEYRKKSKDELTKAINSRFNNTIIPGMVGVVGGNGVIVPKVTTIPNYQGIMDKQITASWLKSQASSLLSNKDAVAKSFDDIMELQRHITKHGDKIKQLSGKLEKVKLDNTNDENDKNIVAIASVSAKNLIMWYQALIFAGTSIVKFGDTAHRLIMMCDENYASQDAKYM